MPTAPQPEHEALRSELQALRASERQLHELLEALPDQAVVRLDAQGRVSSWHPALQRIGGHTPQAVLGQHRGLFFTEADRAAGRPAAELDAAARDGGLAAEGWRLRADGSRFWAETALRALHDAGGQLLGFVEVTRDLTERKHQQDLLARIAELSPTAMLLVDGQGRIRYLNQQAEAMFGHERAALEGQSIHLLIPERFHQAHGAHMRHFMQQVTQRPMGAGRDLHARHRDGHEIEVEVGLSGVDTSEGQAVLAAVVDVSERRRQQRALESALADKDTLLKEVYHRVKNNLQVVQSLLSTQRRSVAEGPARTALDDSVLRVRAMAMVHELLYRSGSLAAVPLRTYTADLLHHIGLLAGVSARGIHMAYDVAMAETGLDAAVPYGLLLVELVSNSLKHAFAGGRGGQVHVTLMPAPGGGARLRVADDGPGLPEGLALDRPRSLGLQLAVSLARQLGGELRLGDGPGAVFVADLPRL